LQSNIRDLQLEKAKLIEENDIKLKDQIEKIQEKNNQLLEKNNQIKCKDIIINQQNNEFHIIKEKSLQKKLQIAQQNIELYHHKNELHNIKLEIADLTIQKNILAQNLNISIPKIVVPTIDNNLHQVFCMVRLNDPNDDYTYKTIRGQEKYIDKRIFKIQQKHQHAMLIHKWENQPNSENLWNRIKEKYGKSGSHEINYNNTSFLLNFPHLLILHDDNYVINMVNQVIAENKEFQ
jgi:hypothetical protein